MIRNLLIILSLGLFLFSCSEEQEVVYSCDQKENAWVKQHLNEIRKMSRTNWLSLPANLEIPVFRAFSQKQKLQVWNEKLNETTEILRNSAEISHINKVKQFINDNPSLFDGDKLSESEEEKIEKFFYSWAKEGEKRFNWNKSTIYSIVGTCRPITNQKNRGIKLLSTVPRVDFINPGLNYKCNCHKKCLIACFPETVFCESDPDCEETNKGCGWVFAQECDGRCDGL
jgi:lipoprotein